MDIDTVVKLRTALRGSNNNPVHVLLDNQHFNIDESAQGSFVRWDDTNGIIYVITIAGGDQSDTSPSNGSGFVKVRASSYESIQAIETCTLNVDDLPDVLDSMESIDPDIWKSNGSDTNEKGYKYKEIIPEVLKKYLRTLTSITHEQSNNLFNGQLNIKDEYYEGRFTENFKETRRYAEYNAAIEAANSATSDSE